MLGFSLQHRNGTNREGSTDPSLEIKAENVIVDQWLRTYGTCPRADMQSLLCWHASHVAPAALDTAALCSEVEQGAPL